VGNGAEEEEVASTRRPETVEARRGQQGMHALKLQGDPCPASAPRNSQIFGFGFGFGFTLIEGVEWKILFSNFSRIAIDRPGL